MCNLINIHTYIRTYIHRRKSARNRKIAVDAARETGEAWVESEKIVERKGWFSSCQPG